MRLLQSTLHITAAIRHHYGIREVVQEPRWTISVTDNPLLKKGVVQVLDLESNMYSKRDQPMWVNVGTVGHCNMPPVHFKGNKHVKL